ETESVDWIAGVARPITKGPAPVVTNRVNHRHADSVLETLQIAHNESAACPRTRQRNVEMIPAGDSGIGGRSVRRDQLAEGIFLPFKFTFGRLFCGKLRVHGSYGSAIPRHRRLTCNRDEFEGYGTAGLLL